MSALVIGTTSYIGSIGDVLLNGGFREIRWRDGATGRFDLDGFQPDLIILIRDGIEEFGINRLLHTALNLNVPLFVL